MSKILRSPGLTRLVLVDRVRACPDRVSVVDIHAVSGPSAREPGLWWPGPGRARHTQPLRAGSGRRRARCLGEARGRKRLARSYSPPRKATTKKADSPTKTKNGATKNDAADSGQLKFSQDIAPILVANCVGCHSGDNVGVRRGKLDLTTFENLKKGSQKRPEDPEIVIAGKPDESHLVLRIKGDEEPRHAPGGQQSHVGRGDRQDRTVGQRGGEA